MRLDRIVTMSFALAALCAAACKPTDKTPPATSDSTATSGVPAAATTPPAGAAASDSTATSGVPAAAANTTNTTKTRPDSLPPKKP
jgi:hypothetical protein